MAGTKEGGLKAAAKNLANNPNFYSEIGRKGGKNGHTGGFAATSEIQCKCDRLSFWHSKAQCAGYKGGTISRRKSKKDVAAN